MSSIDTPGFELHFPARPGFLRICRLNAANFASELDFSVDDLDDLRLAVVEATTWLLDGEPQGDVVLRFDESDGGISIRGSRSGAPVDHEELDDLSHAILGATLDSYSLSTNGDARTIELEKRPTDRG